MRKRLSRIFALFLAAVLCFTSIDVEAFAAIGSTPAFSEEMLTEMEKITGDRSEAEFILQTLYENGIVDRKGMPVDGGNFDVNGVTMTPDELRLVAASHVEDADEAVWVDGTKVSWRFLQSLYAIKDMQDAMNEATVHQYTLSKDQVADFTKSLLLGDVNISGDSGMLMSLLSAPVPGTDTPAEGMSRIYLTETETDGIYKVNAALTTEKFGGQILSDYNMDTHADMTYSFKDMHVMKDSLGNLYIDVKPLSGAKKEEASRVTINLGIDGVYGTGGNFNNSDSVNFEYNSGQITTKEKGKEIIQFSIDAIRDTTVGACSVEFTVQNGALDPTKKVLISTADVIDSQYDPATAQDTITISFADGQDRVHINYLYANLTDCWDKDVLYKCEDWDTVEMVTYATFTNCKNCVVGLEHHKSGENSYVDYVNNYGTYVTYPLAFARKDNEAIYFTGEDNSITNRVDFFSDPTQGIHPEVVIPAGTYHKGDRIPVMIKLNTWIVNDTTGIGATVDLNSYPGAGTSAQVHSHRNLLNTHKVDRLYFDYVAASNLNSFTINASTLNIVGNDGDTENFHYWEDSEYPTQITKLEYANAEFNADGTDANAHISTPDKLLTFDATKASYVLKEDGEYYLRIPVADVSLDYLAWLCADIGTESGTDRSYVKSILSKVTDSEGNASYNKVYVEVSPDVVEYDDQFTGQHVKYNEKPVAIYTKAELDASNEVNMGGTIEFIGIRDIGGSEDLSTWQNSVVTEKLSSGELCRFINIAALYDGYIDQYDSSFNNVLINNRDRSVSKYWIFPCFDFAKAYVKEENVKVAYDSIWQHYLDTTDTNPATMNNIPKLVLNQYSAYTEGRGPLTLSYIADEKNAAGLTLENNSAEYYSWESSNTDIATIANTEQDGIQTGVISFTGNTGDVYFTLKHQDCETGWKSATITVAEATEPYIYVPVTSNPIVALKGDGANVYFVSNIPSYNEAVNAGSKTEYFLQLYKCGTDGKKTGDGILENPIKLEATVAAPQNFFTIPANILNDVSESGEFSYVAEITAKYTGRAYEVNKDMSADLLKNNGDNTFDFYATAQIKVKNAPVRAEMNKLTSNYLLDNAPINVSWLVKGEVSDTATWNLTVTDENGTEVYKTSGTGSDGRPSQYTIPAGIISEDNALKNNTLKKIYTISFAISNDPENEGYSVASTMVYVYNSKALDILVQTNHHSTTVSADGNKVKLDNEPYVQSEADDKGVLDIALATLQTDITLKAAVSINYGDYVWGLVSDQLEWQATDVDPEIDAANLYYSQGGIYTNIDYSLLPSYMPISSFALVGEVEGKSIITAKHAKTNLTTSIEVDVKRLENKFYLFQFYPLYKTSFTYTDGKGAEKTVTSDDNGQLALYEPDGIDPDSLMYYNSNRTVGGRTLYYSGISSAVYLLSGERNSALGETYPVNVLELTKMEEADIFIKTPDGKPLANTDVTVHGGIFFKKDYNDHADKYEDGKLVKISGYEYQPQIDLLTPEQAADSEENEQGDPATSNGLEALTFKTDANGMISVVLNMQQLKDNFKQLYPGEDIMFVLQMEFADDEYKPVVVSHTLLDSDGNASAASVVTLESTKDKILENKGGMYYPKEIKRVEPYITSITETREVSAGRWVPMTIDKDVTALGSDQENPVRRLSFRTMLWSYDNLINESTTDTQSSKKTDFDKYSVYLSDVLKGTEHNKSLGQNEAQQSSKLWYYPFSTIAFADTVMDLNENNYYKKSKTGDLWLPYESSVPVDFAVFCDYGTSGQKISFRTKFPYKIANNLKAPKISEDANFSANVLAYLEGLKGNEEFKLNDVVPGGDMLATSMAYISGLCTGGDYQVNMMICPSADPGVYKVLVTLGDESGIFTWDDANEGEEIEEGVMTHFGNLDPKDLNEAMDEFMGVEKEEDDDDKVKVKFAGALIGEARLQDDHKSWDYTITGGSISMGVEFKPLETTENFLVGPVPVTISFAASASLMKSFTVDQIYLQRYIDSEGKLVYEEKDETGYAVNEKYDVEKTYGFLTDSTLTGEVEAFAGIGFDYSVIALKIGISGKLTAKGYYAIGITGATGPMFGAGIQLEGGIALQFKASILFVDYVEEFASVQFGAGIQSDSYQKLASMFHSPTMQDDTYAGGFASGTATFMNKEASADTGDPMLMARGESIFKKFTQESGNFGEISLSDDGKFIFFSDNYTASYASNTGSNNGPIIDTTRPDAVSGNDKGDFGHFYLDGSGSDGNYFAAWTVQTQQGAEGTVPAADSLAELAIALNSTEIDAAVYNPTTEEWTATRLTDNTAPDMSPAVASYGNKAIVAWRSLYGSDTTNPLNFNVDDNIVFKTYDGSNWSSKATIAYNGTANGKVQALDACMLSDGTAVIAFTVQTDPEGKTEGLETYYSVVNPDGTVLTANASSAADRADDNVKVISVGDEAIIAWYTDECADGREGNDIRLLGVKAGGQLDVELPESVTAIDATLRVTNNFALTGASKADLTIGWSVPYVTTNEEGENETRSIVYVSKLCREPESGKYTLTTPSEMYVTSAGISVDSFLLFGEAGTNKVSAYLSETAYTGSLTKVGTLTAEQVIVRSDYAAGAEGDAAYRKDLDTFKELYPDGIDVNRIPGFFKFEKKTVTLKDELTLVNVYYDQATVIPGITIPVIYTLKNTGIGKIVNVQIDEQVEPINLEPNQQTTVTVLTTIAVPAVDHEFTISDPSGSNKFEKTTGVLRFDIPQVNIEEASVVNEGEGVRTVSVLLQNDSYVPLETSEKKLEIELYTDLGMRTQLGETIVVDEKELVDLDAETVSFDIKISDYVSAYNAQTEDKIKVGTEDEIPAGGLGLVAIARVKEDKADGRVLYENYKPVTLKSMIRDPETPIVTNISNPVITPADASKPGEKGTITGTGLIRNDSIIDRGTKYYWITLTDQEDKVIARELVTAALTPEHEVQFEYGFELDALSAYKEMKFEEATVNGLGTPESDAYDFGGWYTTAALTTGVATGACVGYAKWVSTVYVDFDINGESTPVLYGVDMTIPEAPSVTGYEYDGWMLDDVLYETDAALLEALISKEKENGDYIDVTAVYTRLYDIEVYINGVKNTDKSGTYRDGASLSLTAPDIDNYEFTAWKDDDDTLISEDATFTYTVTGERIIKACYKEEIPPSPKPSSKPSQKPSPEPSSKPSQKPSPVPSSAPSPQPAPAPTPSSVPGTAPTPVTTPGTEPEPIVIVTPAPSVKPQAEKTKEPEPVIVEPGKEPETTPESEKTPDIEPVVNNDTDTKQGGSVVEPPVVMPSEITDDKSDDRKGLSPIAWVGIGIGTAAVAAGGAVFGIRRRRRRMK